MPSATFANYELVWVNWSTATTSTTTLDTTTAWRAWQNTATTAGAYQQQVTYNPPTVRSRRDDMIRRNRQRTAGLRAKALLKAHLDDDQRATFRERQSFVVRAESGKRYEVGYGSVGNIHEIDEAGKRIHKYCIHPSGVPTEDTMLAQKLLLETDEREFLRVANRHF